MPTKASGSKHITTKKSTPCAPVQVLTAFRSLDPKAKVQNGFVRAINLSTDSALLESPDPFRAGQTVELEFLLDNDNLAKTNGTVTHVHKKGAFYLVDVTFDEIDAATKKLIAKQIGK
jgi:hypothetical protein